MCADARRTLAERLLIVTHLSMGELLRRSTSEWPDRPAVSMGDVELTYEELDERSTRCAAALQAMGIGHGTRVALVMHQSPDWVVLHYGLSRLGAVAVPVNLAFEAAEIRFVLERASVEVLIATRTGWGLDIESKLLGADTPGLAGLRHTVMLDTNDSHVPDPDTDAHRAVFGTPGSSVEPPRTRVRAGDAAYVVFTSGSTSFPKPALVPHRAFLGAGAGYAQALGLGSGDRYLALSPTFHVGAISCVLLAPHMTGACTVLTGAFDGGRAVELIERRRCTATVGFDTHFTKMMASARFPDADTSSLRSAVIGATPSYIDRLMQAWSFEHIAPLYGSTESGGLGAVVLPDERDPIARRSSNGQPLPGLEFMITDPQSGERRAPGQDGEICFRGWARFIEYIGMPTETDASIDADGYFHSGDYGSIDEAGNLTFKGRYKMMIKTGGENVSEREVEIFLEDHLDVVQMAQVVGVPDETWGEAVVAFVQLDDITVEPSSLRDVCRGKLANFKIPRHFLPLRPDEWPTLANGRPDKQTLRRMAAERLQPDSQRATSS